MITEEALAEHAKRYGRIKHVVYNGVDLVFRKPSRQEVMQHAAKLDNPQEKIVADEQLAQILLVQCGDKTGMPGSEAFLALLDEYPYLARNEKVGGALSRLTGVVQDEDAKTYGSNSKASGAPQTPTQGA